MSKAKIEKTNETDKPLVRREKVQIASVRNEKETSPHK